MCYSGTAVPAIFHSRGHQHGLHFRWKYRAVWWYDALGNTFLGCAPASADHADIKKHPLHLMWYSWISDGAADAARGQKRPCSGESTQKKGFKGTRCKLRKKIIETRIIITINSSNGTIVWCARSCDAWPNEPTTLGWEHACAHRTVVRNKTLKYVYRRQSTRSSAEFARNTWCCADAADAADGHKWGWAVLETRLGGAATKGIT